MKQSNLFIVSVFITRGKNIYEADWVVLISSRLRRGLYVLIAMLQLHPQPSPSDSFPLPFSLGEDDAAG